MVILNQPILVTGAAGFIGQHLIKRLLLEGCDITALDLPSANFPETWQGKVRIIRGDIRDAVTVERAVATARIVFHLAAITIDAGAEELHRAVTVEGTRNIMQATAHHPVRVVLTSSITVYGTRLQDSTLDEELPWGEAAGIYGRSKQQQEQLARQLAAQRNVELVILRCGNVYGPRSSQWVDGVIAELRRGTPALMGGGDFDAGLCYVDNLIEALLLAATHPDAPGNTYNIADGFGITWKRYFSDLATLARAPQPKPLPRWAARALAALIEPTWKMLRIRTRPPLTYEAYNLLGFPTRFPISHAQAQLGYNPVITYAQALEEIFTYLSAKRK